MKARTILYGLVLLPLLCAIAVPARAQTTSPQETLNQYVADLQKNPDDTALREKIIALVQTMKPAPAIPEAAREHYVMAVTFRDKAKDSTGFEQAVEQYKAALLAAPWWADAYKKLAIAQKAADHYDDAIASLNLYLLTQPADARDAQDEIYKLKALKQSAAEDGLRRQREEQQRRQREQESSPQASFDAFLAKIDGRRYTCQHGGPVASVIDVRGRFLVLGLIDNPYPGYVLWDNFPGPNPLAIQGFETVVIMHPSTTRHHPVEATFTIGADGSGITRHTRFITGDVEDMVFLWQR